ncbi:hypothetical protein [Saccharothrix syringae]|uniref:ABM domain-containing protein n=1 Tax=Saccharothrix syringae TaxID=103733 RepID=A0A5Q0H648_SACSY|nr:hypothetical protein [Saccharothrix syringae]QFZ21686.1 hypothetical protein EKG83_33645 [Saccharothrix syringae]
MAVVETIRFRLVDGFDEAKFREVDIRMQREYMEPKPGFVSRQSAVSEDGEWLVVVTWASRDAAQAVISAFYGAPETQDFLAAVDLSTVRSGSYALVEH